MARLFYALQPTLCESAAMHQLAAALLPDLGGAPVHAADLHLTLCFLGEVAGHELDAALPMVQHIRPARLELTFELVDYWRRSRLLCLLPASGAALDAVAHLALQLREATRAAGLRCDARPFRPHLTLARKVAPQSPDRWQWPRTPGRTLALTADGFTLMRSAGSGDGPRYTAVRCWPQSAAGLPTPAGS